jgi:hypothetical protein
MTGDKDTATSGVGRSADPTATYGDFVEAMRQKRVHGHADGVLLEISRLERKRNWSIPSYDFGRLLDPTYLRNVLGRIPPTGSLPPPIKRDRAFLFTFGSERQVLIQRYGISDYPDDDDGPRFWFYAKAAGGPWLSMDGKKARWESLWIEATYLLTNPEFIEVAHSRASVGVANLRRRMAGAALLPATGVVNLTRFRRLGAAAPGTGLGSPKRPHDRSGHERRLRDGRVIKVRACEVHSGAAPSPIDLVVRP